MDLKSLKSLAEKFRLVADDKAAVKKLCDATCLDNPDDADVTDLCDNLSNCADGAAVRALCDGVKARSV